MDVKTMRRAIRAALEENSKRQWHITKWYKLAQWLNGDIERPRYLLADEFEIPPPIPKDEYQKLSTLYCDYQDHLDNTKEENELNKLLKLYETKQFDLIDPKRWNYFLQIYIWPKEPK